MNPEAFVGLYGNVSVRMGDYPHPMLLSQAAQAVAMCKGDPRKIRDPETVVRHFAGKVGAAHLAPEHLYLLEPHPGDS
jgi:hypothetical protein